MVKVKLEFEIPEEQELLERAVNAEKLFSSIWDYDNWLYGEIKYNNKNYLEEARKKLHEFTADMNLW